MNHYPSITKDLIGKYLISQRNTFDSYGLIKGNQYLIEGMENGYDDSVVYVKFKGIDKPVLLYVKNTNTRHLIIDNTLITDEITKQLNILEENYGRIS